MSSLASAYNFSADLPASSSVVVPHAASRHKAAPKATSALRRQREKVIAKRAVGEPGSGNYRDAPLAPQAAAADDDGALEAGDASIETRSGAVDAALHGQRLDKALVSLA